MAVESGLAAPSATILPDIAYRLHDRGMLLTACGRICMHRKKINISTVPAGQRLGIKEVDEGIWLVSFMHYDLGYIDLKQKNLANHRQPGRPQGCRLCLRYKVLPMSPGRTQIRSGGAGGIRTLDTPFGRIMV